MVDRENVDVIIKMAAAAAGGMDQLKERPICICSCCVISPLTMANQFSKTLTGALEAGVNSDIMVMDHECITNNGLLEDFEAQYRSSA